jgi:hypothetical protein
MSSPALCHQRRSHAEHDSIDTGLPSRVSVISTKADMQRGQLSLGM